MFVDIADCILNVETKHIKTLTLMRWNILQNVGWSRIKAMISAASGRIEMFHNIRMTMILFASDHRIYCNANIHILSNGMQDRNMCTGIYDVFNIIITTRVFVSKYWNNFIFCCRNKIRRIFYPIWRITTIISYHGNIPNCF